MGTGLRRRRCGGRPAAGLALGSPPNPQNCLPDRQLKFIIPAGVGARGILPAIFTGLRFVLVQCPPRVEVLGSTAGEFGPAGLYWKFPIPAQQARSYSLPDPPNGKVNLSTGQESLMLR